ncbi:MAG: hypothetical protein JWO53_350 [Chlamydiia bacterium]|nr:hypothetical protein [Chlamydiia bacterium]
MTSSSGVPNDRLFADVDLATMLNKAKDEKNVVTILKSQKGNIGIKELKNINFLRKIIGKLEGSIIDVNIDGKVHTVGKRSVEEFILRNATYAGVSVHKNTYSLSVEEIQTYLNLILKSEKVQTARESFRELSIGKNLPALNKAIIKIAQQNLTKIQESLKIKNIHIDTNILQGTFNQFKELFEKLGIQDKFKDFFPSKNENQLLYSLDISKFIKASDFKRMLSEFNIEQLLKTATESDKKSILALNDLIIHLKRAVQKAEEDKPEIQAKKLELKTQLEKAQKLQKIVGPQIKRNLPLPGRMGVTTKQSKKASVEEPVVVRQTRRTPPPLPNQKQAPIASHAQKTPPPPLLKNSISANSLKLEKPAALNREWSTSPNRDINSRIQEGLKNHKLLNDTDKNTIYHWTIAASFNLDNLLEQIALFKKLAPNEKTALKRAAMDAIKDITDVVNNDKTNTEAAKKLKTAIQIRDSL